MMPTPMWDQLFKPMVASQRWIAAGFVRDPVVREKAGMRWTPGDEVLLRLFGKAVEVAFWAVPGEIRLHPRALSAYRRAAGRIPADAPWSRPQRSWRRQGPSRTADALRAPPQGPRRARGSLVHTATFSLAGLRPARDRSAA